ncbi:MAG: alpha/beta hydrolase [Betaproteobacteria bacterium]|nr:alpha/beta hydrolase [Betaproteobacteria bacterium]
MGNSEVEAGGDLVPGGGRDLDALKEEVQRRADRNMPPLGGIGSEDAHSALSQIRSLGREEWAGEWMRVADQRWERARSLDAKNLAEVRDEYWRAWRLFHFARWPTENSPARQRAKHRALQAFQTYGRLLDPPLEVVRIPFEGKQIVGYLRLPLRPRPAPLVFGIAGLDSRKEDIGAHSDTYLKQGIGLFAVDLPGTGESPLATAETDADRIFSEVLDYLEKRPEVDASRIVVQGRSWSGYWAAKLAITERARLRGTVMHGGPIHHYFQPDWLKASLATGEYLYDYLAAKCALVGARSLEEMLERMGRFSLLEAGLLDQPSAPMLCVNGARDSQIPIADVFVLLEHGDPKEAWINPVGGHMGRSPEWPSPAIAEKVLMPWVARQLERRVQ